MAKSYTLVWRNRRLAWAPRGTIARIFGRPIPVLIHELEYYDEIAAQNRRANPDGLADPFAAWIEAFTQGA